MAAGDSSAVHNKFMVYPFACLVVDATWGC